MSAFYTLAPKINIIQKIQSGGNNQGWIDTLYNITKQMQIMLGELSDEEIMTDREGTNFIQYMQMMMAHQFEDREQNPHQHSYNNQTIFSPLHTHPGNLQEGEPPPYFDRTLLPRLDRTQIAWWDECHIEQHGGKVENRAYE